MTPNRLPYINVTVIRVYIYGNGLPIDDLEVSSVNGTAVFNVFYYGNQFTDGIVIDVRHISLSVRQLAFLLMKAISCPGVADR